MAKKKRRGLSYKKRVADINAIYEKYIETGLSNREIWGRYVYPIYAISERSFYNIINASLEPKNKVPDDFKQLLIDFDNGNK